MENFTPLPSLIGGLLIGLASAALGAGLLVGFGTQLGDGCTSGHGICGLSRFSLRSSAAVLTFMGVAAITVFVVQRLFGGAL